MLCAQSYKNRSLETSREDKEKIRAELNRRGVICTEQFKWAYVPVNRPIETPIDNTKTNVVKSEKVSKSENEERKTNIAISKNTKLDDSQFSKKCEGGVFSKGYKKGTEEFNDCVKREEKLAALDIQKRELMNEEKNKKIALEENNKQKAIQQKQELEQAKIKEEQTKISKMKPEDRHAYTCTEKFGFRKGSDKFKDCVFKIYQAELELEKLELQRELAKANAETARVRAEAARASEERQQNLARAQAEAATMQAIAARQQAIAANTASSLQMIESGLRMMSPQQSNSVRLKTNCTYIGRDLSCF